MPSAAGMTSCAQPIVSKSAITSGPASGGRPRPQHDASNRKSGRQKRARVARKQSYFPSGFDATMTALTLSWILPDEGSFASRKCVRQPDSVGGYERLGKRLRPAPVDRPRLLAKRRGPAFNSSLKNNRHVVNHVSFRIANNLKVARLAVDADHTSCLNRVTGLFLDLPLYRG